MRPKGTQLLQAEGEVFLSRWSLGAKEEQWLEEEERQVELEVGMEAS